MVRFTEIHLAKIISYIVTSIFVNDLATQRETWQGLTLISAWISNYNRYKVWDEIAYSFFQTSAVQPLKFENAISSHILLAMWLVIHVGIEVNQCY